MAKSIFNIRSFKRGHQQTIHEIASDFWHILFELSKIDDMFKKVVLKKGNHKNVSFKITAYEKETTIQLIASAILRFSKEDIYKYEKEYNPTIEYFRPFGFSFIASFYEGKREKFYINPKMGTDTTDSIDASFFSIEFNMDFDWYLNILKVIIDKSNGQIGGVFLRGSTFINETVKYNARLGWITYFSNDYELEIPNNLDGFEYEFTDKGKYLIATREDFTVSKEAYQAQKEKLLKAMEYLKETVPGYAKE